MDVSIGLGTMKQFHSQNQKNSQTDRDSLFTSRTFLCIVYVLGIILDIQNFLVNKYNLYFRKYLSERDICIISFSAFIKYLQNQPKGKRCIMARDFRDFCIQLAVLIISGSGLRQNILLGSMGLNKCIHLILEKKQSKRGKKVPSNMPFYAIPPVTCFIPLELTSSLAI